MHAASGSQLLLPALLWDIFFLFCHNGEMCCKQALVMADAYLACRSRYRVPMSAPLLRSTSCSFMMSGAHASPALVCI